MKIFDAVDLFIREKKLSGFSPKTISFYTNALKNLFHNLIPKQVGGDI